MLGRLPNRRSSSLSHSGRVFWSCASNSQFNTGSYRSQWGLTRPWPSKKLVFILYILSDSETVGDFRRTVAHNCHIKTKCSQQITNRSQQIQIAHSKFKSLKANSNRSQQIQIAHSKLQIARSKLQIAHSKFKSPTANSNHSQQIKVAHIKFKLLTANYKLLTPIGVFGYIYSQRCNSSKNICHLMWQLWATVQTKLYRPEIGKFWH